MADAELKVHTRAYLRLFQAALKKLPLSDAEARLRLQKLRTYIQEKVAGPEDFLSHISHFARMLGIREAALSSFVGANFMQALTLSRREIAESAESSGNEQNVGKEQNAGGRMAASVVTTQNHAGGIVGPESETSLLAEILSCLGTMVEQPGRFAVLEAGMLKFMGGQGETMARSYAGAEALASVAVGPVGSVQMAPAVSADASDTIVHPGPVPEAHAKSDSISSERVLPTEPVQTIIAEILQKFGSSLDISGKLEPLAMPPEVEPAVSAQASHASVPELATVQIADSAAVQPSAGMPHHRDTSSRSDTKRIIPEILEQFGSVLAIHGKLCPTVDATTGDTEEEALHGALATEEVGHPVEAPAIPLSFQDYASCLRKITEFQSSGDQNAYRLWLGNEAGLAGKGFVGIRNLEARARKSSEFTWAKEYENLASHLGSVSGTQMKGFHNRIINLRRIHQLTNELRIELRLQAPDIKSGFKKIWPQLMYLFNERQTVSGYTTELQVMLLQIPDTGIKADIQNVMMPVIEKLAQAYQSL